MNIRPEDPPEVREAKRQWLGGADGKTTRRRKSYEHAKARQIAREIGAEIRKELLT
jgi:hypothetical protein